jgi:hypothetical protein
MNAKQERNELARVLAMVESLGEFNAMTTDKRRLAARAVAALSEMDDDSALVAVIAAERRGLTTREENHRAIARQGIQEWLFGARILSAPTYAARQTVAA